MGRRQSAGLSWNNLQLILGNNAIGYAKRRSPSNRALIRVCDQGGNGSAFTHVVLCAAAPPKEHMGKVSPTFIDITLGICVWQ